MISDFDGLEKLARVQKPGEKQSQIFDRSKKKSGEISLMQLRLGAEGKKAT